MSGRQERLVVLILAVLRWDGKLTLLWKILYEFLLEAVASWE